MPEPCGRTFDEALLSGHLDGALVQGDEQRVRVHLEDCGTCRTLVEELAEVREATMSSTFNIPGDHEWSEAPRTEASRLIRGLGWPLVIAWAILVGGYAIWQGWLESENLVEQLILVGGVSGFAMLFLGVLLDRLKAMKTNPYREVRK
ncbi:MAG: hypothetical protein CL477_11670 [Acidobacteria bacterium]|jgi:predicted anti-sigma-YlaC factor YlaD|nr:hypothetical protein [Acidobacteriota bacterium]MDP7478207.1 zf-HC2 domain-containing protein [Vicinamibacterales bacterium]MDP7690596.1 zf-HC2 domain-containing protein [Vicinamibacterales bacterium]HJN44029.1 zf-HC2 domain-containing protein [Vicinamibacterales bacterium]|tara:strand:+ start:472 stop:915 length:444 start_codon:yes stop_codon:yes gene_type:complete